MKQGEIIEMIDNFNAKYTSYVEHIESIHNTLQEFNNYSEFLSAKPETQLSVNDFNRYKNKHTLTETQFWNVLVEHEKIRKNVINQATKGIK